MSKNIPLPKEYTDESVKRSGLAELFYMFQKGFAKKGTELSHNLWRANRGGDFVDITGPNYNVYIGMLERACHASQKLLPEYDITVGIASKGLWLSYVLELYGWNVENLLIVRTRSDGRIVFPLSKTTRDTFRNKKVLLLDNDMVTGKTVEFASRKLREDERAKSIDALLCWGVTRLDDNAYAQFKYSIRPEAEIIGKDYNGRTVIDTRCMKPENIRRLRTLDQEFTPERKYLKPIARKLGVRI